MAQTSIGMLLQSASSGSLKLSNRADLKQTASAPEFGQYLNVEQAAPRGGKSSGQSSVDSFSRREVTIKRSPNHNAHNPERGSTAEATHASVERQRSRNSASDDAHQAADVKKTTKETSSSSAQVSISQDKISDSDAAKDAHAVTESGKSVPEEGEALPLDERTREVLAQLDNEQLNKVLSKLTQWLHQHPDADLDQLNLPDELKVQLDQLTSQLGLQFDDLSDAVRDLASILQQLPEGQRYQLAWREGVEGPNGKSLELMIVRSSQSPLEGHDATVKSQEALVSEVVNKWRQQQASSERDAQAVQKSTESTSLKQQQDMLMSESLFNRYVASQKEQKMALSMNAIEMSSIDAKGGARSDSLQQLMQTAGQGLQQLQSSAINGGRAVMPTLPLMTAQASAAQSNASALVERIAIMQSRNMKIADIRLDPPELGALRIRIHMQGDQANISFQSPHAHVREALEQSMPRLREMLAGQGMDMGEANVADQQQGERSIAQDMAAAQDNHGAGGASGLGQESGLEFDDEGVSITVPQRQLIGLVDAYA